MSEEVVPQQGVGVDAGPPKGLLQQMEELMAALNADLSELESRAQARKEPAEAPREDHLASMTRADPHTPQQ